MPAGMMLAMTDDNLENAYEAPITGQQVASWALDVLEDLYADLTLPPGPQSQAALDRLAEIGEPARVMGAILQAAAMVLREAHFQASPARGPEHATEMVARSFLSARAVFRGDGPRDPFKPSSEG